MKGRKKFKGRKLNGFIYAHNKNFVESLGLREETVKKGCVSLGQELEVSITAIGSKGDGTAKYGPYTVVVPNTKINDTVKAVIKKITQNMVFGEKK